jgi:hypothetical protein
MGRTLVSSLAGAVVGFLIGMVLVVVMSGSPPARDTAGIALLVGVFLAGSGAVAGAIIGGVADLREHLTRNGQATKEAPHRDV